MDEESDAIEKEPTVFALASVNTSCFSECALEKKLSAVLRSEVSILAKDNDAHSVLFMLVPSVAGGGDSDDETNRRNHFEEEQVMSRFRQYILSTKDRKEEEHSQEPTGLPSPSSWLLDLKQAEITIAEMEEEEYVSEDVAYELWLNNNNNDGTDRTSGLALVPTPDGELVQPRHHQAKSNHNKNTNSDNGVGSACSQQQRRQSVSTSASIQAQLQRDPTLFDVDNVRRITFSELGLSFSSLKETVLSWKEPVVITGLFEKDDRLPQHQQSLSKQNLIDKFGDAIVRTGNRETLIENGFHNSEPKPLRDVLWCEANNSESASNNGGTIIFSPIKELEQAFQHDLRSATRTTSDNGNSIFDSILDDPKYTLCLAHQGFGIGMHKHGPAMFYLVNGRKKWYMSPPKPIDNDLSLGHPTHPHFYQQKSPFKCIQQPGEILFVPNQWYHEIFNLDTYTAGIQALGC